MSLARLFYDRIEQEIVVKEGMLPNDLKDETKRIGSICTDTYYGDTKRDSRFVFRWRQL